MVSKGDQIKEMPHPPNSDFSGPSFSTVVQDYAQKTERPLTIYGYGRDTLRGKSALLEESNEEEVKEVRMDDLTLAQSMNFEVINVDDTMSTRTKNVRPYLTYQSVIYSSIYLFICPFIHIYLLLFSIVYRNTDVIPNQSRIRERIG